jgi:FixJ family two-component response regulator
MPAEPTVWIIDSEHWPRACLGAELIERGFNAVGYVELDRALAALRRSKTLRPLVIVLELRGQELTSDKLGELAETGIPIVAIGGASERSDPLAQEFRWAMLFSRPVTIGRIADAVESLVHRPMARNK